MSGRTVGRYRLASSTEGRVGTVLPAEDTLLDRQVGVLLVPAAAAAEPARAARIRQEVERATAFVHPNVATVYGMEEDDGQLFVTLEPAAGRSLASVLTAGELALAETLEIALALVDVLASAKQDGVVHGGLHPGDVLLGDDGSITVSGFGLHELRLAAEAEIDEPSRVESYRPPEAAPGLLPDHRADLYALGRLVREMLAAGAPAAGAEGQPTEEAMDELEAALERFLSEDPALRPHSADELRPHLEQLQRDLLHKPEPESEETVPQRLLAGRARWGLVAAVVLLVAIAGWALWRGLRRAEPTPEPAAGEELGLVAVEPVDLAVMPFAAPDDATAGFLAAGFGREVTRLLTRNKRVSVIAADSAAQATAGDVSVEQAAGRLGVVHLLEGSFLWQLDADISRAEVTVRLSRAGDGEILWEETLEAFFGEVAGLQDRVAAEVARRLGAGGRLGGRSITDSAGAYRAYLEGVGRSAEAATPEELRDAVASLERATTLDPGLLLAHTRQVGLQIGLAAAEPADEALAAARRALASASRIDAVDPDVQSAVGELELASGGDPTVALEGFETALGRVPGHPDLLRAVALIDRRQGRWDEAIERLTAARRRDPLDLGLGAELVRTLTWKRRFDEATEQLERLATMWPDASEPVLLHADLLLRESGATGRARAVLEAMPEAARADLRWQERMLRLDLYEGEYESALARLPGLRLEQTEELIERAWIHRHMGRESRSATGFERARDLLDDRLEAEPDDPALSSLLGQAYGGTGGPLLAVRMGQRAVSQLPVTREAVAGVELVQRFARIYVLAGDYEHALDELAFLLEIPSPVTVAVLRLDPAWDPLRDEARFQELLERFGP